MGRTVSTWRMRIEERMVAWNNFRRALRTEDKLALDRVANSVRERAAAGGLMSTSEPMEPMFLAAMVEAYSKIARLERRIEELES